MMLNWLLSVVLMAGIPTGELTITMPDYQVLMTPKVGWTISTLKYQDVPMVLAMGGQGSMLSTGGKWYGAGSSPEPTETVGTLNIQAERLETDLEGDLTATGDKVSIHKESTIVSVKHTADTTFEKDLIVQRHQFEATEDLNLASFYGFVYSLTPQARHWLAQPLDGETLQGDFNADRGTKPQQSVRWMAQYDPAVQKGILFYYQKPMAGPGAFDGFWDTDGYHKMLSQPLKGLLAKGTKLDLTLVMQPFSSPAETWEAKAKEIASGLQTRFPQAVGQVETKRIYGEGVPETGLLTFKAGRYTVPFSADQAWTLYRIESDGYTVAHEHGYYGTVLVPKDSNFWGTGHTEGGREVVHSVHVKVDDGPETAVSQQVMGTALSGQKLTLTKRSTIWKFDCLSEVTVSDAGIRERTKLVATEDLELKLLYYFMHCFVPTTTHWAAELPDGSFSSGELKSDGDFEINKDTRWVAQHEPGRQLGLLCYTPKVISGPGSASRIWDLGATRYHKFYYQANTVRPMKKDEALDYTVYVQVVPGEKGDWSATKAAAAELAKTYPHEN